MDIPKTLIVLLCILSPLVVSAASFDCQHPVTPIEPIICTNKDLSRLDDAMAIQYQVALISEQDIKVVEIEQEAWMRIRNACPDAACLRDTYKKRLLHLVAIACNNVATREYDKIDETDVRLPWTVDGRWVPLCKDECRHGYIGNHKDAFYTQTSIEELRADCVEAGIYNPCDEMGSEIAISNCQDAKETVETRWQRRRGKLKGAE